VAFEKPYLAAVPKSRVTDPFGVSGRARAFGQNIQLG